MITIPTYVRRKQHDDELHFITRSHSFLKTFIYTASQTAAYMYVTHLLQLFTLFLFFCADFKCPSEQENTKVRNLLQCLRRHH